MTEIYRKRWLALAQADRDAEIERAELLRAILIECNWKLSRVASLLHTRDTSLIRILHRHPALHAEYDTHKTRGVRPSTKVQQ